MIGLFYGSDTGITEEVTNEVVEYFEEIEVHEICDVTLNTFNQYQHIILGLSTWYDGDLQSDWGAFFEDFKTIDFTDKKVAIYGLGDQIGYAEYFIDGVGILAEEIIKNGGEVVGLWPTNGYLQTESKAIVPHNPNLFYGLAIDNDNESNLTEERLKRWIDIIKEKF
ncbi:flavodoxin [Wenyingzhuangia sp. IMCC45533]